MKQVVGNLVKDGHDRFHLHEIRELIQKLPFYASLKLADNEPPNNHDLNYLARAVKYQHLYAGECLYRQGDKCTDVYIILSGKVSVLKPALD